MRGFAKLVTNCVLEDPGMRGCIVENWVLLYPLLSAFGLILVESPETLLGPLKSLILAFNCQIVTGFSLGFC